MVFLFFSLSVISLSYPSLPHDSKSHFYGKNSLIFVSNLDLCPELQNLNSHLQSISGWMLPYPYISAYVPQINISMAELSSLSWSSTKIHIFSPELCLCWWFCNLLVYQIKTLESSWTPTFLTHIISIYLVNLATVSFYVMPWQLPWVSPYYIFSGALIPSPLH